MGNCSKIPRTSSSENLQQSGHSQANLNNAGRAAPSNNPNANPQFQPAPNFAANNSNLLPQQPVNYQVPVQRPMPVNYNPYSMPPQQMPHQGYPPPPPQQNYQRYSQPPPPPQQNPHGYSQPPPPQQNHHGYSQPPPNQQRANISSIPLNVAHNQPSGNLKVASGQALVRHSRIVNDILNFSLDDDGLYWVDFEYSVKFRSTVIINFMGRENSTSHEIYFDQKNKHGPQNFIIEPTQKGLFSKKYKINLDSLSKNQLEVADKCTFPIIIEITSTDTEKKIQTLISCFKIIKESDNYSGVIVKQTIKANEKYYPLLNLYGTSTDSQESECLICLTELKTIAVLPCRHVCYCEACVNEVKNKNKTDCPICRCPVQSFLSVKHN
ncbi:hypothetical protein SteCoe_37605 [Stentor coeruleus]|uniref:RING-type domain-containing protein n=1 Tax=Stentor coeruleus TaxID=5963 RepID=A0A1R2AMP6_9CILI|nr:hypothetical protein SteCoe_37605 [Stentor coeruleus]